MKKLLLAMSLLGCGINVAQAQVQAIAASEEVAQVGDMLVLEGPVWVPGTGLLFTDVPASRILQLSDDGSVSTWASPTGDSNGLILDLQGRVVAVEDIGRRVVRYEADGSITELAADYQGQRINSPNDVAIDNRGRIYFTDPGFRDAEIKERRDSNGELVHGIYRIDPNGSIEMVSEHYVVPNGVNISPDNNYLYTAEMRGPETGSAQLVRFDLDVNGDIDGNSRTVLYDYNGMGYVDGMAVDMEGNVYAAGRFTPELSQQADGATAGVAVFSENGEILQVIGVGSAGATNVTFGGDDLETLYITGGNQIWAAPALAPGYVAGLSPSQ